MHCQRLLLAPGAGGLDGVGSGAEGTVKGARVVISTAQLSRSIADVYVVRKDYFDAMNRLSRKFEKKHGVSRVYGRYR